MKFLECKDIPDIENLGSLAENNRLNSYPALRRKLFCLKRGYVEYLQAKGNASESHAFTPISLTQSLKEALIGHYSSPPDSLQPFLKTLREKGSPDVCPMCGSFGSRTLDHIFPKNDFPQFSVFSKNLVPACGCNTNRREVLIGSEAGERILHPYFDGVLKKRVVRAQIHPSPDFDSPTIEIKVVLSQSHSNFKAVFFHVENVLKKSGIYNYFDCTWPKITRNPRLYLGLRGTTRISECILKRSLKLLIMDTDVHYGTPNNWKSMLLSGIAANHAAQIFFIRKIRSLRRQHLDSADLYPN